MVLRARGPGAEPAPNSVEITELESLAAADAREWDLMAGDRVLASYGWLYSLASARVHPELCRYVVARLDGCVAGAIVCRLERAARDVFNLDDVLLGRFAPAARVAGLSTQPALVCGGVEGVIEPVLLHQDLPAAERGQVIDELIRAAEDIADARDCTLCFRGVAESARSMRTIFAKRGYLKTRELPAACLRLESEWRTFADYRRHLRKTHPRTAKHLSAELNRAGREGLVIERIKRVEPYREAITGLMNQHYRRRNGSDFPLRAEFFEQLKRRLGDRAVIRTAKIGDEMVGVLLSLEEPGAVYVPMIGMDPERGRAAAAYFNLGYNRPIEDAIAAGRRRMYFGKTVYDTKARRGCVGVEMDLYLRPRRKIFGPALRPILGLRSRAIEHMTRVLPRAQ